MLDMYLGDVSHGMFVMIQSIGASLALKKWGDWTVALWVSKLLHRLVAPYIAG